MLGLRSDLPLRRDASGRFLPWLIGFMVYLAALAAAGSMAVDGALARWQLDLAGSMTVQIVPPADATPEERQARRDRAIEILGRTPGISRAQALGEEALQALLQPWLGEDAALSDLPLPDLVAVELQRGAALDVEAMRRELAEAVPGATLDDHRRWIDDLAALAGTAHLVALLVVGLVGLAAVVTIVFVTRTGLAIHGRVIEVVHLIGARDAYIAGQFQRHALWLGLLGGVLGVGFAIGTIIGFDALLHRLGTPLLPRLAFGRPQWAVLAVLPLVAAAIAMLTARITVLRSLGRTV